MGTRACSVDECGNASRSKMGLCGKHYAKWKRYGDPLGGRPPVLACAVDGCSELQQAKGYCKIHYARWNRTGDPGPAGRRNFPRPPECTVEGCGAATRARGLCVKHWERWHRYGDVNAHPFSPKGSRQCEMPGCDRPYMARGLCSGHYYDPAVARARRDALKEKIFGHYGRACSCCGATEDLTLDHVNGDGAQHRLELYGNPQGSGGTRFYRWLIKQGLPPGYQTLCRRCNISKAKGEFCRIDHAATPSYRSPSRRMVPG
jgi:hypothetical protein